jgi:hypothetical protein
MYREELDRTENPQLRQLAQTRIEALEKSMGKGQPAGGGMGK